MNPSRSRAVRADGGSAVAELQGLYGPFVFPEKLLQKIWLRGDFARDRLQTTAGDAVRILGAGTWNLLGGPDFKGARLCFGDGEPVTGDVELHLHAADWVAHRHAQDPAYDRVVLHVVLFPPSAGHVTRGAGGREIPVVALLPWLLHDLEEYAAEDAVETLANRPAARILETLGPLPAGELEALINRHAAERWQRKVHYARLRVERLGWTEACHQTALEILGYRFNRAPMLRLAGRFRLAEWADEAGDVEAWFESELGGWSLQGLRPANHPWRRLRQYAEWVRARPDWPARLAEAGARLPALAAGLATAEMRRRGRLAALRAEFLREICADAVGGTRFDNLACDGFWPLVAARAGGDLRGVWHHWFLGDLPPVLRTALRQLGLFDGARRPACHGVAQGLLGWLIARETPAPVPPGRGA